jgi:hypothetical protein
MSEKEETKVCTQCDKEKSIKEFRVDRSICKTCQNKYFKNRYYESKKEQSLYPNKKHKCNVCGKVKAYRDFAIGKLSTCKSCENKRSAEYYVLNMDQVKARNLQNAHRYKTSVKQYRTSHGSFYVYAPRLEFAEIVKESPDGKLVCFCAYCGKGFLPTVTMINNRIKCLNGVNGGESRFYCSDECKGACPIYNRVKYPKGFKIASSREVPAEFRQFALKERGYTCEKCDSTENGLHVHHIEGYTEQPMFAADLVNVMVVCKACHNKIHSQPGCRYHDYRCDVQLAAHYAAA